VAEEPIPTLAEAKQTLRRHMREQRRSLGASYRHEGALRIAERVAREPEWVSARVVTLYWSLQDELDTEPLFAAARGKLVGLPVTPARGQPLSFREPRQPPVAGPYGTREPPEAAPLVPLPEVDVFVVPALAVDLAGRRLGYGGGFYDRTLVLAPRGLRVVACFECQVADAVPADPHDALVDLVVTERRAIRTGARP
jgi:5-formyltetrahydrofolate cyclo-ligase